MKIHKNNLIVPIEKVKPNEYNPKKENLEVIAQCKKSLEAHGQVVPIIVRETENGYEIINGYHRYMAMLEMGIEELEIKNLGKLSRSEAIRKAISTEVIKNPVDEIEMAVLIKEMAIELDGNLDALSQDLPFSVEELQEKIDMINFDWDNMKNDEKMPEDTDKFVFKFEDKEKAEFIRRTLKGHTELHECSNEIALYDIFRKYNDLIDND